MISFIVPIRNEEKTINETIKSIVNQKSEQKYEIIVADGLSNDGTRNIIKDLCKVHKCIKLIDNPDKIVSTGFNRALSITKGDVILRVDGHATISPDYIEQCLKAFKNTDADCVGGPIINSSKGVIGQSIKLAQSSNFGTGGASFRGTLKKGKFVNTLAFGAYKRNVFNSIGGYDEELVRNQDDEFNMRLIQSGGKIWLDPSIKSFYYSRSSLLSFTKQYFQYGFYKIRVMQKRKGFASFRHIVPLCFIVALIITSFLYFFYKINIPFLLIIGIYFSLSIIASFIHLFSFRYKLFSIVFLPLCYFTMHSSYGVGTLIGMFYFVNKWNDREVKDNHFNAKRFSENATH
tara:strand:- start:229 stop:1269 length:1041 start_codon:yes stop_codon:yes gene_type:complete